VDWLAPDAGRAGLDEGGKQMTDDDIKRLRRLAEQATPGPWRVNMKGHSYHEVARVNDLEVAPPDSVELAHCADDAAYIAAVSPDVVLGLIDEVLTSRRRIGALTTLTDAQTARLQSYMNDGAKRAEAINTLASEREANALLTDEIERLRADRDDVRAELTNLQIAFNDWKVTHSTVRLEVEIERLREFERSAALTLPGVYYMDPPDGGDVSLLKQLQRSSIDAARYRWLRERAPFWAWQPDSNCYPGITVGFSHSETKYCDYTLDEAIDAAMGEEKRE